MGRLLPGPRPLGATGRMRAYCDWQNNLTRPAHSRPIGSWNRRSTRRACSPRGRRRAAAGLLPGAALCAGRRRRITLTCRGPWCGSSFRQGPTQRGRRPCENRQCVWFIRVDGVGLLKFDFHTGRRPRTTKSYRRRRSSAGASTRARRRASTGASRWKTCGRSSSTRSCGPTRRGASSSSPSAGRSRPGHLR